MGNGLHRSKVINPGAVLDRVISQSNNSDDCLLYKLANYKKGGELVEAYNMGGPSEVEKLFLEQFGILMYKAGKGQIVSRTEYLRWKFRNTKHVVIPVEPTSIFDPLGKWEDHEACWQMQYRGSLGETLLHLLIICDTRLHTKLARILLKCYPKLAVDVVEGEEYLGASPLHLAIAYNNNELVHLLVASGAKIEQRAIGSFFLPRDQQRIPPSKSTEYEGLAYLGEYPLAWAACVNNETVYNLLLDHDADPDQQDSFGNTILHMVVVTDQLGMYGYALRHPKTCASNDVVNNQGLTPLTLACRLGRASVFREMLEQSCKEFWRYSNITCSAYPLNALDTIHPDGKTNWNSALFMILAGSKEEHLDMLDGGIIQRLLEEKWKTFAQRQFLKRISIAFIHLLVMSVAVYLRPRDRGHPLNKWVEGWDIVRMVFEVFTIFGCLSFVIVQQGGEIKNTGLLSYLKQLPRAPPKALFLVANFLILLCIPFRISGDVQTEEKLLAFALVFSWFFMMFFAGAIELTGPFVTMVYSMITGDMLTFSIIYTIFLLTFSQAFFYLYKGHPDQQGTLFPEFDSTWLALYQMTLGSYNYAELSQLAYPNAAKTVFIIFMIMVPILLLNMLIAMMGNTYAQVIERSEKERVKQWAKIVVTLERAVSVEDAKNYIQEYSIKLSGTDPSNEVRGVMVIKSKSKTRAKQRKGAVANWKRVGKVTITALKRRKMTGEQMRQLMWGHRNSVCTPKNATPRQLSVEADHLSKEAQAAAGRIDGAASQLNTTMTTVDGSSPARGSPPTKLVQQGTVPAAAISTPAPPPQSHLPPVSAGGGKSRRRGKIGGGLRPKIIIFSEKKDLIRVTLDSDEDEESDKEDEKFHNHSFIHKHHKSAKRRSIAGDSMNITSSRESLAGDTTEIEEKQEEGIVNPSFIKEEEETRSEIDTPSPIPSKPGNNSKVTVVGDSPGQSKGQGQGQSSSATRPKSGKPKKKEQETVRPKSGKSKVEKDKSPAPAGATAEGKEEKKRSRPLTALDKWSDEDKVQNMNKLVAWDRPEDDDI